MEQLQQERTIVVITSSVIYLFYKISEKHLFNELFKCLALVDQQKLDKNSTLIVDLIPTKWLKCFVRVCLPLNDITLSNSNTLGKKRAQIVSVPFLFEA